MTFQRKGEGAVTTKPSARGWLHRREGHPERRKDKGHLGTGLWVVMEVTAQRVYLWKLLELFVLFRCGTSGDLGKPNERKRNKQGKKKKKNHQKLIPNDVESESFSLFKLLIDSQL